MSKKIVLMTFFGITATIVTSFSCLCTQYDSDDLATLLDIRDNLDPSGTVLTNWDSAYTCSSGFIGVYCDSDGKVNAIILYEPLIYGVFPSSIGDLSALQELSISKTHLSGPIPSSISNLVHLNTINLYDNYLNGSIPDVFDTLTNLTTVDFEYNLLTGELPKSLGNLSNLQILRLGRNSFWGSIPEEIGSLSNLMFLDLKSNYFSGYVPSTISNICVNSTYANVSLNCLTPLVDPTDSCSVLPLRSTSDCYTFCDASQEGGPCAGHGTCKISSYYCICDIGYATTTSRPYTCSPEGTSPSPVPIVAPSPPPVPIVAPSPPPVPIVVPSPPPVPIVAPSPPPVPIVAPSPPPLMFYPPPPFQTTLKECNCQNFTSDDITVLLAIRPILDPYGVLTDWDPSFSCRNGWFGVYCDSESHVDLIIIDSVPLKGTIPPLLLKLRRLIGFSLQNTSLFGGIPGSLASLPELAHIYLGYNSFTGPIPEEIFAMPSLQNLWIPYNRLTGNIPNGLSNLKKIVTISLSGNNLTGSIPTEISTLTTLRALWLDNNSFSGSIPEGIGNLPALSALDLSYNYFTGGIPSDIEVKCGQYSVYYFHYSCLTVSDNERCTFTTPQKDAFTCRPFCNGGQAGGACGGHGNCSLQYSPFQASCDCDSGYGIVNDDFTCVATSSVTFSPPPPPLRSSATSNVLRGGGMNYYLGAAIGVMILVVIY